MKVTIYLIVGFVLIGFILPYLYSAKSTEMVLLGTIISGIYLFAANRSFNIIKRIKDEIKNY